MDNNFKSTKKQMASLGLKKTKNGYYDYINPDDKIDKKYEHVRKES